MADEIQISELELADELLQDMVLPVETATDTKATTLLQLKKWLGSSLPTGFIIASLGRIDDARFTLLDGKTLSRTGTYEEFCNKVIEQVQLGNWFACSQSEYDEDLSSKGQCGRFVIEDDYVRIPTLGKSLCSGVVNGTIPVVGNGMTLGLTNNTNDFGIGVYDGRGIGLSTGNYGLQAGLNTSAENATLTTVGITTDPEKSGIEGKINSVEVYYYMVISTEGQTTPISVDINQVHEDINLKANKDLSDVTQIGKETVVGWGMPSDTYIDLTLGDSGSSYTAPANGFYEVQYTAKSNDCYVALFGDLTEQKHTASSANYSSVWVPVKKGKEVSITYKNMTLRKFKFIYAEGTK